MGKGQNKEKDLGDKTKQEFDTVRRELSWPECRIRKESYMLCGRPPDTRSPLHERHAEHVSKQQLAFAGAAKWAFAATM